jgi:MYXO-CTERM domain-containing protein
VNSIVATAAPEANFISILGLGLLGLAFMRRRAVGVWPNC